MSMAEQPITLQSLIQLHHDLRSACSRALARSRRTAQKQEAERAEARDHAHYQQIGDTLLASLAGLRRGMSETILTNVHTQADEIIKLNPKLDGPGNAELYFRKARKSRRGIEQIERMIVQTTHQISVLESLHGQLAASVPAASDCPDEPSQEHLEQSLSALRTIESSLRDLHALPSSRTQSVDTPTESSLPYRTFRIDGHEILVGKNSADNDELTVRVAKPWDIWMHVGVHAGSHVVVRRNRGADMPPERVLSVAASLAAWFSKARHAGSVEVHMTEKRYVTKRRHSPAGQVMLSQYKTLRVSPVNPQEMFRGQS